MWCLLIWPIVVLASVFILFRLTCGMCRSAVCLAGKTAIVTGGNSGIGFQVCLNLAARGCKVIIADINDSEKSRLEIIQQTNNPHVTSKIVNLASFKSIREFATDLHKDIDRVDILVNNAGIGSSLRITEDGLDETMQVNYFGPFLLTHLLLDLLKRSENGRIVFTSSLMCWTTFITSFGLIGKLVGYSSYAQSKLATNVASDIFAQKLKGTRIAVHSVHPGLVAKTNIYNSILDNNFIRFIAFVCLELPAQLVGKDPYEGSQTTIHAAISQEASKDSGQFFCDCIPTPFLKPIQAYNKKFCKQIWKISENRVHLKPEERI